MITEVFKKIIFVILFVLVSPTGYGQINSILSSPIGTNVQIIGEYNNIELALKEPDKVIVLNLMGLGLKVFPKEIKKFKNLEELNLGYNEIESFPRYICKLSKLRIINLRKNRLKSIPKIFFSLPIERIDLWGNEIQIASVKGAVWRKSLKEINISMNNTILLDDSFSELDSLKILRLEGNNIRTIPIAISKMKSIEEIYLENCKIFTYDYTIRNSQTLMYIGLAENPISIVEVEELRKLLPNCKIDY